MFAVVGVWELDPETRQAQTAAREHIVAGVAHLPGLVKGYWSDSSDQTRSRAFIVFDGHASAESFASSVRRNTENQARSGVRNISLDVLEVRATT